MTLTREEVENIAYLARLALTEAELIAYQGQLAAILAYAERLNELDIAGVPPTAQVVARQNVLRADVVVAGLPLADVAYNAPQMAGDQFVIQAVLADGGAADG